LLPKLSIVIPSYNQGAYIEETILSIVNQDYPGKELIIIDGGSTDNSVDVIKKYGQHIAYWVSEKDEGQAHAINKGFERATGDYIAWMNADDTYYENAFRKIFALPDIQQFDFIYGPVCTGTTPGNAVCINSKESNVFSLFNLLHFFYNLNYIVGSQSVFVKKSFLEQHGIKYLNNECHYCMDMEWYCRIALKKPSYLKYDFPASFFRINEFTKTGSQMNKMKTEAIQIFLDYKMHLKTNEQNRLFRLLFLERALQKLYKQKNRQLIMLIKVLLKIPSESLSDRRFLGLFKAVLKGNKPQPISL
jgi:glycosyltransferase involved in cell wall biosynthesis